MNIDEITEFTYSRNNLWPKIVSKEAIRRGFEANKDKVIEVRINGDLVCVAFFLRLKDELHFVSVTVKEDVNGLSTILRGLRKKIKETGVHYVSWINPEYRLKRFKVKGG